MATYIMEFRGIVEFEASADGDAQTKAHDYTSKIKQIGRMRSFVDTTAVPAHPLLPPKPDYREGSRVIPGFRP